MAPWPPTAQAPWSPTAQAFAQHQFSHVTNFWKQGRPASFRLEALPDGNAELNLTFKLPKASEVIPPPFFSSPAPLLKRPIIPLFPEGYAPQKGKPKQAPKLPSRRRKNYRRSVLHKAALAMHTLPPPVNGSLRQAAQACVQRLQAASALPVSAPTTKKRSYATPMAVVFQAAAAQRRARQAEHAEFYIRFATSGLRASPYLEPIPPPSEIHAAALLCLLRGAQRWV